MRVKGQRKRAGAIGILERASVRTLNLRRGCPNSPEVGVAILTIC